MSFGSGITTFVTSDGRADARCPRKSSRGSRPLSAWPERRAASRDRAARAERAAKLAVHGERVSVAEGVPVAGDTIRLVSETAWAAVAQTRVESRTDAPRHAALARVTHWLTAFCFLALLISGLEIVVSHPRFYWGESGNVLTPPLFSLPIPASRSTVPTGYGFVLPDQNGWSRALHFQSAWLLVLTGILYAIWGAASGHFRTNLLPVRSDRSLAALSRALAQHFRSPRIAVRETHSYNLVQRITYLAVIFGLFPLVIWTGLAMSPAFVSALPATATALGGRQSARTIHFIVSLILVAFLAVHVAMIWLAGFGARVMPMITGAPPPTRGQE